jgi:hypothetical protein
MWYRLSKSYDENRVKHPLQTSEDELFGVTPFELQQGRRIENWNPNSSLRSASPADDGEPDDVVCESLGLPTFSGRLQKALREAGIGINDIQYLPIRLFQSTGEEIKGFAIANVVTRLEALDRERCVLLGEGAQIDPLTGKPAVTSIGRIALQGAALQEHDVVRLAEFFPPVLVSERFAKLFHEGEFTGAILTPLLVDGVKAPDSYSMLQRRLQRKRRPGAITAPHPDLRLPGDFVEFLQKGLQLKYDPVQAQPGRLLLLDLDELTLGTVNVSLEESPLADSDPNAEKNGYYVVPAVNLVAACEAYSPNGILVWLPNEREFGTWDCDHYVLRVFPGVSWSQIAADPVPYLDAQWDPETVANDYLVPWPRYPFKLHAP